MNPRALQLVDPLDVDDARLASRALASQRREAEKAHEQQIKHAAEAEANYRRALAGEFVKAEGTAAEREAVARAAVADLSYKRDVAAGMVKAYAEQLRGLEGERSMLKSLIDWSARMNIDGREA